MEIGIGWGPTIWKKIRIDHKNVQFYVHASVHAIVLEAVHKPCGQLELGGEGVFVKCPHPVHRGKGGGAVICPVDKWIIVEKIIAHQYHSNIISIV